MALKEWFAALDGYMEKLGHDKPLPPPTEEESSVLEKYSAPTKSIKS